MSEPIFFRWLEIEGFRGFARRERFDLDSSVVILIGPNGTGKTSFFDAIQWLLLGSLERLEPWRLRRNTEHVVNQYRAALSEPATVAAGICLDDRNVELRRQGRYDKSRLEWSDEDGVLYDDAAQAALVSALTPLGRMSLQQSLLTSGLLQQDVIRDVLEDKPAARYEQLAAILGLNAVAGFPAAARKRADKLAEDGVAARDRVARLETQARETRERISTLEGRATAAPDIEKLQADLRGVLEANSEYVGIRGAVPARVDDAERIGKAASVAAATLSSLPAAPMKDVADRAAESGPSSEDLEAFRRASDAAQGAVDRAQETLSEAQRRYESQREVSSRLTALAAQAIPLLGEQCPVCEQSIDPDHVRRHLEMLVANAPGDLEGLRRAVETATSDLATRRQNLVRAQTSLQTAIARSEEIGRASSALASWQSALAEALRSVEDERFDLKVSSAVLERDASARDSTKRGLEQIAEACSRLAAGLQWSREAPAISGGRARLSEIEPDLTEARDQAAAASAAEDGARSLQRASVRAVAGVTEERFALLRPVIQDIYTRLDPHPSFTDLRFAVEVYRERGVVSAEVWDPELELNADPLLVFSSSQANVVALSSFLALGWSSGPDAMPFLLLDDPLQSLDDVNALGFADLCRHMRSRRQLIVSTHDHRLSGLLARKLAARTPGQTTRLFRFVAWSREGPIIDHKDLDTQVEQGARRVLVRT